MRSLIISGRAATLVFAAGVLALSFSGGAVAGGLVTSAQIKDDTVTSADLHDHTIRTVDISDGARRALQGGVSGYQVLDQGTVYTPPHGFTSITVDCPQGLVPLGYGTYWEDGRAAWTQVRLDGAGGYTASGDNPSDTVGSLHLQVVCAQAG